VYSSCRFTNQLHSQRVCSARPSRRPNLWTVPHRIRDYRGRLRRGRQRYGILSVLPHAFRRHVPCGKVQYLPRAPLARLWLAMVLYHIQRQSSPPLLCFPSPVLTQLYAQICAVYTFTYLFHIRYAAPVRRAMTRLIAWRRRHEAQ
jgi:hypothetical protein